MKGVLIVSLDFELFWGMMDCTSLDKYKENILGGRNAVPKLLNLFEKYNIHATWATVGFMFAKNREELIKYLPKKCYMPTYKDSVLNPYNIISSIGENEKISPCFYGESLINLISKTKGQEIGSHTFSHYYCREEGQTKEQFEADMKSAIKIAQDKGYKLDSVILPRNQCTDECVEVLNKLGFLSYRDEENDWIHEKIKIRPIMRILRLLDVYFPLTGNGGYKPKIDKKLVNLVGSRMYKPFFRPLFFLEKQKIKRIKKQMLHAAQKGLTFHLWWHPHNIGVKTEFHLKQLEEIFSYYSFLEKEYGMKSMNMKECATEILKGSEV